MSSTDSPTLIVNARFRRTDARVTAFALAAGACAPWLLTAAPLTSALYATLGIAAGLAAGLRAAGWLGGPKRIETLAWSADGRWTLVQRNGVSLEAQLHPGTRVWRSGAWLRWRIQGRFFHTRSVLLHADDAPELRRLLVRLRIDGWRLDATSVAP